MSNTNPSEAKGNPVKSLRLMKTIRRLFEMARVYKWAAVLSIALILVSGPLQGVALPFCFGLTLYSVTGEFETPGMKIDIPTTQQSEKLETSLAPETDQPTPVTNDEGIPEDSEGDESFFNWLALRILEKIPVGSQNVFFLFVGLLILIYFLKCLTDGLQIYLSQLFAQRVIFALRERLHSHLIRLSSAFFASQRTGDLMSRTTNDVNMLQHLVSTELVQAMRSPVVALSSLAGMFVLNVKLTLIVISAGPFVAYLISRGSKRMRTISRQVQRRLGALNTHLQERLSAVRVVQLFTREEFEIKKFQEINEKNIRSNLRAVKVRALLNPGIEFLAFMGLMVALLFAGWQMIHGAGKFPTFMAFIFLAYQTGTGLIKIGKVRLALDQALAAGERIFEILDTESDVKDPADPVHLKQAEGRLDFVDVSFRYATGEEVLRKINLTIAPGEIVALVGPSGAGKTSLINLIPRFYDPTAGAICVDGIDIRKLSLHSLRSQIGIVPQETHLFAGSVYENILYGKLDATEDEVIAAAKAANAHEFIVEMRKGYQSEVGERGLRLSGGQRQRIAIARALLKNPRILIMDEPTSSLDMKSEALVLDALGKLMVGRTSVVIAHRPSTIRNADRILVLSEGRIVEEGSHTKLLAAGGIYSMLYEGQFSAPMELDET